MDCRSSFLYATAQPRANLTLFWTPRSARLGPEEMARGEIWSSGGTVATWFNVRRGVEPLMAKSHLRQCLEELATVPAPLGAGRDPSWPPLVHRLTVSVDLDGRTATSLTKTVSAGRVTRRSWP